MYWIRYQPLKDRLKKRSISDREALPYLLLFSGLEAIALSLPATSEMNKWDIIQTISYVLVTLLGVFYVYRRNGGNDGYDIIQKIVVLGWVVAVRYFLVVIPLSVTIYLIVHYHAPTGDETTLFDAVFYTVISAIYYERLGRHISDTNEKNGAQANPVDPE
jgi:hypothetical protein